MDWRSCWRCATFIARGHRKSVASSTNRIVLSLIVPAPIRWIRPCYVALWRMVYNGSITRMNNIGDIGLSWRSPRPCLIGCPVSPFNRIQEVVVFQSRDMMSLHHWLNPIFSIISCKYSHRTELKAFAMSSLMNNMGVLARWKCLMAPCTYWKLSCRLLPFMKVLWHFEMILSRYGLRAKLHNYIEYLIQELFF